MCLTLRRHSDRPYNKSNIRWKVVERRGSVLRPLHCSHVTPRYAGIGKQNEAILARWVSKREKVYASLYGFHVFVTKADADKYALALRCYNLAFGERRGRKLVVVRVRASGFHRSGVFKTGTYEPFYAQCETYRRMTILEIIKP